MKNSNQFEKQEYFHEFTKENLNEKIIQFILPILAHLIECEIFKNLKSKNLKVLCVTFGGIVTLRVLFKCPNVSHMFVWGQIPRNGPRGLETPKMIHRFKNWRLKF